MTKAWNKSKSGAKITTASKGQCSSHICCCYDWPKLTGPWLRRVFSRSEPNAATNESVILLCLCPSCIFVSDWPHWIWSTPFTITLVQISCFASLINGFTKTWVGSNSFAYNDYCRWLTFSNHSVIFVLQFKAWTSYHIIGTAHVEIYIE